jgi:hypothetical protein
VKRHGTAIKDFPLPEGVNTGITHSAAFGHWEACVAANLNPLHWDAGIYSPSAMDKVVAWYEGHRLIELHTQAALAKAAKREMKKR